MPQRNCYKFPCLNIIKNNLIPCTEISAFETLTGLKKPVPIQKTCYGTSSKILELVQIQTVPKDKLKYMIVQHMYKQQKCNFSFETKQLNYIFYVYILSSTVFVMFAFVHTDCEEVSLRTLISFQKFLHCNFNTSQGPVVQSPNSTNANLAQDKAHISSLQLVEVIIRL